MAQSSSPSISVLFYLGALILFMTTILLATAGGAIGYSRLTAGYIDTHPDGWTILLFGGLLSICLCNALACVGMHMLFKRVFSRIAPITAPIPTLSA